MKLSQFIFALLVPGLSVITGCSGESIVAPRNPSPKPGLPIENKTPASDPGTGRKARLALPLNISFIAPSIPVQLAASGAEDGQVVYSLRTSPLHGTLSGAAPVLTYTPNVGYVGEDSFQFEATDSGFNSSRATVTLNILNFEKVFLGYRHSCAILINGSLVCWGGNEFGQLGIGAIGYSTFPIQVPLGEGRTAVSVALGTFHSCVILDNGSLKCWGNNSDGELGLGNRTEHHSPQGVSLGVGRTAKEVAAGDYHTCAVLDDGSLKCWGYNGFGQLGLGNLTAYNIPQRVSLGVGRTAKALALKSAQSCAVLDDGSLKCWGYRSDGQVGIGNATTTTQPEVVSFGAGRTVKSVKLGIYHSCVLLDDRSLKCWGGNEYGQLGLGNNSVFATPQEVSLGAGRIAESIEIGFHHTCAVLDDGSLKCWGSNGTGQLGMGGAIDQTSPQLLSIGLNRTAKSVSLGADHTCTTFNDNSLKCWGDNQIGQLGVGDTETRGIFGNETIDKLPKVTFMEEAALLLLGIFNDEDSGNLFEVERL